MTIGSNKKETKNKHNVPRRRYIRNKSITKKFPFLCFFVFSIFPFNLSPSKYKMFFYLPQYHKAITSVLFMGHPCDVHGSSLYHGIHIRSIGHLANRICIYTSNTRPHNAIIYAASDTYCHIRTFCSYILQIRRYEGITTQ